MCIVEKVVVVDARYMPDKLFYKLIKVFKPKDQGYEWFRYSGRDLSLSTRDYIKIGKWIQKQIRKQLGKSIESSNYVLLYFLYGYDTYKENTPARWENDIYN